MCERAFCTKFAVALQLPSERIRLSELDAIVYTFAKYLQGVSAVDISVEWEKGQAFPA